MKDNKSDVVLPDILSEDGNGDIDELESSTSTVQPSEKKATTKNEFSKKLCVAAVIIFTGVAIYSILAYYYLMRLAIETQSSVTPDASLPIAGVTSILAAVLSYCLYQGALKTSLNKNNLMIDNEGTIKPILQDIVFKDDGPHC